jgi:hypothetical protein
MGISLSSCKRFLGNKGDDNFRAARLSPANLAITAQALGAVSHND